MVLLEEIPAQVMYRTGEELDFISSVGRKFLLVLIVSGSFFGCLPHLPKRHGISKPFFLV